MLYEMEHVQQKKFFLTSLKVSKKPKALSDIKKCHFCIYFLF